MKHEVFWKNPGYKPFSYLNKDSECDYLIVGGGVAGVSLAYFLVSEGKDVILLEKNTVASGATGNAAGSLVASGEIDLMDLVRRHGSKKSQEHWQLLEESLEQIKHTIKKEKIDCDFEVQDTMYCSGFSTKKNSFLEKEYHYLKKIDKDAKLLKEESLREELNTPLFREAILNPKKGVSVNPLKFTQNLARVVAKKGGKIYENTEVKEVRNNLAKTNHSKIKFKHIIWTIDVAYPDEDVKNRMATIAISKPLTLKQIEKTCLENKKFIKRKIAWSDKKYYEYFKVLKDRRILFGLGDVIVHKRYNKKDPHPPHIERVRKWVKDLFPYLNIQIDYIWSATYGITEHFTPAIESKGHVHSISGAGSQVVCFMAARQIANKLLNRPHRLDLLYL